MNVFQFEYFIAVIYVSLVIGAILKFYLHGARGALYLVCPLIPFLVFGCEIAVILDILKKNVAVKEKLNDIKGSLISTVVAFPVLVGYTANGLLKHAAAKKRYRTRKKQGNAFRALVSTIQLVLVNCEDDYRDMPKVY